MNDAEGTQKPPSIRDSAQNHLSGRVMTVGDLRACKDPSRACNRCPCSFDRNKSHSKENRVQLLARDEGWELVARLFKTPI